MDLRFPRAPAGKDEPVDPLSHAEEIVLLAFEDHAGRASGSVTALHAGLAAAVLVDLADAGALTRRDDDVLLPTGAGGRPPTEPHARALARITAEAGEERDSTRWMEDLIHVLAPIQMTVAEALVTRGILHREDDRVLGIFPRTSYPETDHAPEAALRARLEAVLLDGAAPGPRDHVLIALLAGAGMIGDAVPKRARHDATARAKQLREDLPAATPPDLLVREVSDSLVALHLTLVLG